MERENYDIVDWSCEEDNGSNSESEHYREELSDMLKDSKNRAKATEKTYSGMNSSKVY